MSTPEANCGCPHSDHSRVQEMMRRYVKRADLGAYVENSAVPVGDGVWRFYTMIPGGTPQRREITQDELERGSREGVGEPTDAAQRRDIQRRMRLQKAAHKAIENGNRRFYTRGGQMFVVEPSYTIYVDDRPVEYNVPLFNAVEWLLDHGVWGFDGPKGVVPLVHEDVASEGDPSAMGDDPKIHGKQIGHGTYNVDVYTAGGGMIDLTRNASRERAFGDAVEILTNGLTVNHKRVDVRGVKVIQRTSRGEVAMEAANLDELREYAADCIGVHSNGAPAPGTTAVVQAGENYETNYARAQTCAKRALESIGIRYERLTTETSAVGDFRFTARVAPTPTDQSGAVASIIVRRDETEVSKGRGHAQTFEYGFGSAAEAPAPKTEPAVQWTDKRPFTLKVTKGGEITTYGPFERVGQAIDKMDKHGSPGAQAVIFDKSKVAQYRGDKARFCFGRTRWSRA